MERDEINQMAKYMAAINETFPAENLVRSEFDGNVNLAALNGESGGSNGISRAPVMVGSAGIDDMKSILEKMYKATGDLVSEAPYDKPLRRALTVEKTYHGAKIGNWDIVVTEEGKRKFYSVIHEATSNIIASELSLYETALGIVNELNEGGRINSSHIVSLLYAEQEYSGAINNMINHRHTIKNNPTNSSKRKIAEDRYQAAKEKATLAKKRAIEISESI